MRKAIIILILLCIVLTFISCNLFYFNSKPELTPKKEMTIILHAGGELNGKRLLNCQEAFYYYYELGYRYFEYDLKLSGDGKLIATHSWEHLYDGYDGISYEDFLSLKLDGGYTPANEDWLIEILKKYPDITIIVDAKMETTILDAAVIKRFNELQSIHNIDLSDRIISEIFSIEMWEELKDEVSFNQFLFSRYKEYYSISEVVKSFPVGKFIGIALPYTNLDGYYIDNIPYLQELGYRIFMFSIYSDSDVSGARDLGADTVYIDNLDMIPKE